MPEQKKGFKEKIMEMLPDSMTKRAAKAEVGYQERQKKAIAEQTGEDPKNGTDAGEVGKPWDETFKKNE
jgi:hypothetical protein